MLVIVMEEHIRILRGRIEAENFEYKFTETAYRRFLIGRKEAIDDAFHAMKKHVEWRIENNVEAVTADDCPTELAKKVVQIGGVDKQGRPLVTVIAGRHNKHDRDIDEMKKLIIYIIEQAGKLTDPAIEKVTVVFDLTAFSMRCMDFEVVKMLVHILDSNYPEVLGQALVVNAPFIFSACWRIIKPWLDPMTAAKVSFVSLKELPAHVDEQHIPPEVGSKEIREVEKHREGSH